MSIATIDALTPREREVLAYIAEGDSLAEIAQKLSRSLKTIESHRLSIGRKLNASNRVELAKIAIASGLISLSPQDDAAGSGDGIEPSLELQWLEQINAAVYSTPGRRYIDALCQAITSVMGVRFCAVCMPDPQAPAFSRFTVSIAERGKSLDPIWYHGQGTPAETVVKEGQCVIKNDVQAAYPEDELMKSIGIQSYIGVRLKDALGQSPGIIAVSHDAALEHAESIKRILHFFVPRTSAELARMAQEEQLRELNQKLQSYTAKPSGSEAVSGTAAGGINVDNAIQRLQLLMSTRTGSRLLGELVNMLCEVTGVQFAAICMRDKAEQEPTLVTLAVSESERSSDTLRYPIAGTPCEQSIETGYYAMGHGLTDQFPDNELVVDRGLQGYVGVRLDDSEGEPLGVLWVVDDKPIPDTEPLLAILQMLVSRVAAEVEERLKLDHLHHRCEHLESRLHELSHRSDGEQ